MCFQKLESHVACQIPVRFQKRRHDQVILEHVFLRPFRKAVAGLQSHPLQDPLSGTKQLIRLILTLLA